MLSSRCERNYTYLGRGRLAAARARGRKGGRPKQLDEGQVRVAITLAEAGELMIREICEQVGCSRSTYYRQVAPRLKVPAETELHSSSLLRSYNSLVKCYLHCNNDPSGHN